MQLSGGGTEALPQRFSDLKKQLWRDGMEDRWREVLADLETETQNIKRVGSEVRSLFSLAFALLQSADLTSLRSSGRS